MHLTGEIKRFVAPVLVLAALAAPGVALAWKPYTHNFAGEKILEAIDFNNSTIQIDGQSYPVDRRVTEAIRACRACFHAGVVGPDGFPDVTYGQAVIHPARTGEWLNHLYKKAWEAQGSSTYSDQEKKQILAFTYGFLFHAAGDMWGHTIVNELSGEVFPPIADALVDPEKLGIAIKHIAVEGVIGDATPGFDGDRERRKTAPGDYGQSSGDISNDATPGFPYEVPRRFIYEALIAATDTPERPQRYQYAKARGPMIGFFMEMHDGLSDFIANSSPDPLQDAIDSYQETVAAFNAMRSDCDFTDFLDAAHDLVACPADLLALGFIFAVDSAEAFTNIVLGLTEDLIYAVLDAYLAAWVEDIEEGLQSWADFGLESSRGLFDAQTRRNVQNEECGWRGPESSSLRADCENGIGLRKTLFVSVEPFVNDHLLSMVGLPDFVGDVREILGEIEVTMEDILGVIGLPFNPLISAVIDIKEWVDDLILDAISDVIGFDIEELDRLFKEPAHFLCWSGLQVSVHGVQYGVPLFQNGERQRLDDYLGFTNSNHAPEQDVPPGCGRLTNNSEFDVDGFPAFRSTVQLGKLILVEGEGLNGLLTQRLGRTISTYGTGAQEHVNVMLESLDEPDGSWLRIIDSDHAWRRDGLPVFAHHALDENGHERLGGDGHMPMWSSCVLRPAFRTVFSDWESPWQGARGPLPGTALESFPSLADAPQSDLLNDPLPPLSHLGLAGATYSDGTARFVAADNAFTFTASDSITSPAGKSFRPEELELRRRIYSDPANPGGFVAAGQGEVLHLGGADGKYYIEYQSSDPCHTFGDAIEPVGAPETPKRVSAILDTKAPAVSCFNPPFGLSFTTAGSVVIRFGVSDGALGSGVASTSATIDGVLGAVVPASSGQSFTLFDLEPGTRTVTVSAADNLNNAGQTQCTFQVHATPQSLLANLQRLYANGQISYGMYQSLAAKLRASRAAKLRGQPETELNILHAFIGELRAQSGKHIDAALAEKLIEFAQDIMGIGG